MKFHGDAGTNPIDKETVVGKPIHRIDGLIKVTGSATYAYEHRDIPPDAVYGWVVGSEIPKGTIKSLDKAKALAMPGVLAVISTLEVDTIAGGQWTQLPLFGGSHVRHYQQAIAMVIAETFEQARDAAFQVDVEYELEFDGVYDLHGNVASAVPVPDSINFPDGPILDTLGDFEKAFAAAPVKIDQQYTTPYQSHSMMEPHATIAAWQGDTLLVWTSNQMINWARTDLPEVLSLPEDKVHIRAPFIGGGFGAKLGIHCDVILAALGAKEVNRPVKVALQRPLIMNNTVHRPATVARVRLGSDENGKLNAISHISTFGNVRKGMVEPSTSQTRLLYAAANREVGLRQLYHDLPEGSAMRAPGEATGLMALEVAMDELAEALQIDPVELRLRNASSTVPQEPDVRFTACHLSECLRKGAEEFDWKRRNSRPGEVWQDGWLSGMGVAVGIRDHQLTPSNARIRLGVDGRITVECDMTDIGTGSYTIIAQTAAEMMGVGIEDVTVSLGDSTFPKSAGSGGQWGAGNVTAGVYVACASMRQLLASKLGLNESEVTFENGKIISGSRSTELKELAAEGEIVCEDGIEFPEDKTIHQSTFAGHFAEVAVNAYTGETRVKRMLAVCDVGRVLNPITARSQVLGGMVMGVGGALVEEMAVDPNRGFFVNHDLGGYEVAVNADIQEQEVIFLNYPDSETSPMKAKGVGELGLCGAAAAVANAIYNATGVRVRDYPITLEKHLLDLPKTARNFAH